MFLAIIANIVHPCSANLEKWANCRHHSPRAWVWRMGGVLAGTEVENQPIPLLPQCAKSCALYTARTVLCSYRPLLPHRMPSPRPSGAIGYLGQLYKILSGKMSFTTEHCTSWKESPTLTKCFLCGSSRGNNHHFTHTQSFACPS